MVFVSGFISFAGDQEVAHMIFILRDDSLSQLISTNIRDHMPGNASQSGQFEETNPTTQIEASRLSPTAVRSKTQPRSVQTIDQIGLASVFQPN